MPVLSPVVAKGTNSRFETFSLRSRREGEEHLLQPRADRIAGLNGSLRPGALAYEHELGSLAELLEFRVGIVILPDDVPVGKIDFQQIPELE